jgi:RNA polymerase sigma-70 factor (ECF subfamily)
MSQKEIASEMQLSQSTVEKHIAKGLLKTMLYMREHDQSQVAKTKHDNSLHPLTEKRVAK